MHRRKLFLLILIFFISFFFRFYKLQDFLIFGMDQEDEILIVKNIVTGKHFPLIGLSSSDTGIYRGPFFLYLSSIPYLLFGGNPVGGALFSSIVGVIVTYLIYKLGSKMFSSSIGLTASLLYAGSFLVSYYDRQFWNPSFIPFFSLLIGFMCFEVIRKKSYKISLLLIILFGIATHAHLTILIFTPLIIWVFLKIRKILNIKRVLLALVLLTFTQLPLLLFDLRHNFLNTKAVIKILTNSGSTRTSTSFNQRKMLFASTLGRYIWVPPIADFMVESGQCKELLPLMKNQQNLGAGLMVFITGCVLLYSRKKSTFKSISKGLHIPLALVLLTVIFSVFYNRLIYQYYFSFLFPWLSIILAWCFIIIWQYKKTRLVLNFLILIFVILNVITLVSSRYSFSYKEKLDALSFASEILGKSPYSLEALGECPRFGGQRYLAEYKAGVPIRSYMDSYFAWLYPEAIKDDPNAKVVLLSMIDPFMEENLIRRWEESKVWYLTNYDVLVKDKFGKIGVFILGPL